MRSSQSVSVMSGHDVNATRVIASVLGVVAGLSGLDHGFFETLQGNAPTPGLFVQSIGPAQRMWLYGTEDAFSLIPNFLATGILAIAVGLLVIVWSIGFIGRPYGSRVFVGLGALLFLVGGGVALVGFVVLCWAVSTRIDRPPAWVRNAGAGIPARLARLWLGALVRSLMLAAVALEIAIFGFVPGVTDPNQVQAICWLALGIMLVPLALAIVGGFAHDINRSAVRARPEASR
ncbi:MAG: hypothetical protein ABSC46_14170 [Candidatus Limnocylindrales bacterium]